jgi:pimeloyl-ACP methyl ester carboxylesterase
MAASRQVEKARHEPLEHTWPKGDEAHRQPRLYGPSDTTLAAVGGTIAVAAAWAMLEQAQARRAESDNPPIGRFITVDGVRLHYVEKGRGRPVVLLHGNGSLLQDFASSVLDEAAKRYRVIAVERPGFGYSDRPKDRDWSAEEQAALLRKMLWRLRADNPVILGHSWAAGVALAYAMQYRREAAAIVAMSGYYYPTARLDFLALGVPALPVVGTVMRHTISPTLARLLAPRIIAKLFDPNPVAESFENNFPVPLAIRPGQLRAAAAESGMLIATAARLRRRYGSIQVPVVIVAGADDRIVDPYEQSAHLYRDIPEAELRIIPRTGHMVQHSRPMEVLDAIELAWTLADGS